MSPTYYNKASDGFIDPEAAHQSRIQYEIFRLRVKIESVFRYRVVRVYTVLLIVLFLVYILSGVLPNDLRQSEEKSNFELLELTTYEPTYTSFQPYTPYRTIIQSKELLAKYNEGTLIQKVVYPKSDTFTLAAVRFKKELNRLKAELRKTLKEESFTCIPAIALGIPYNLFMDQLGNLFLNIEIVAIPNPTENTTVAVSGLFDMETNEQQEEELFDMVEVRFTESNAFSERKNRSFVDLDAYCLQMYLKGFAFENSSKTRQRLLKPEL